MEWQLISDSSREGKMSSGAGGAYARRGRPGHYEEELVAELLRREERCDVREKRREAAIEAARSLGKCGKTVRERKEERGDGATHL